MIVNEVLSRSADPLLDQVELLNTTAAPIDLAGWHLSDTSANYFRYTFPAGVTIGPSEYLVLDQSQLGFAFDGPFGDDIWLLQGDPDRAGKPLRFADQLRFDATETSVSLGLWPNGDPGGTLFPMTQPTFGAANSGPQLGNAIISELHYHPAPPPAGGSIGTEDLEFVEIHNRSGTPLTLDGWQVDGFGYRFPVGVMLQPAATIVVVPFDPAAEPAKAAAFQAVYGIAQAPTLLGPATGSLQDGGETIRLLRPENLSVPTGYLLVDQLGYDNQAPWPPEADGAGQSLVRITANTFGGLPASWMADVPSPGSTTLFLPGDVNADGQINGLDVAPFVRLLLNGSYQVAADMDADGVINGLDVEPFVAVVVGPGLGAYGQDGSPLHCPQRRSTIPVFLSQVLGHRHTSVHDRIPHHTRRFRVAAARSAAELGLDTVRSETPNPASLTSPVR